MHCKFVQPLTNATRQMLSVCKNIEVATTYSLQHLLKTVSFLNSIPEILLYAVEYVTARRWQLCAGNTCIQQEVHCSFTKPVLTMCIMYQQCKSSISARQALCTSSAGEGMGKPASNRCRCIRQAHRLALCSNETAV